MKLFPLIALCLSFFISSIVLSQSKIDMHDVAANHLEGINMKQTEMFVRFYHKDIQIIGFPSNVLKEGRDSCIAYWEKVFLDFPEQGIEPVGSAQVVNSIFITYNEFDPNLMVKVKRAMYLEFKDEKIYRIYLINS